MILLKKAEEPLGGRALLEEVSQSWWTLGFHRQAPPPFILSFLSVNATRQPAPVPAPKISLPVASLLHYSELYSSGTVKHNKPFPLYVALITVFYHNEKITQTHLESSWHSGLSVTSVFMGGYRDPQGKLIS